MTLRLTFVKGHGTMNDFIVIPDLDNEWDPSAEQIAWLCDRRRGIGADGVLRLVRTSKYREAMAVSPATEFFMDYRNADGTVAEMCGNGIRVFGRYIWESGLSTVDQISVGTRGGPVPLRRHGDAITAVLPGPARAPREDVEVLASERTWRARGVFIPNPHAVVLDARLADLGDITPIVRPAAAFPEGVNVEFVERRGPDHIAMRVHERGVGETMSCGTGACAAAWVARETWNPRSSTWRVDVPGGTLHVSFPDDGTVHLTGPATLVAEGHVTLP